MRVYVDGKYVRPEDVPENQYYLVRSTRYSDPYYDPYKPDRTEQNERRRHETAR